MAKPSARAICKDARAIFLQVANPLVNLASLCARLPTIRTLGMLEAESSSMQNRSIMALMFVGMLSVSTVRSQFVTNALPAGTPATPSPRQLPSPQTPLIKQAEAERARSSLMIAPVNTNRLFPPSTNSNNSANLARGEWFYPNGTNAFYHRGTNFFFVRGTNGFYTASSEGGIAEFVPDGNNVYRLGPDGVYHHYDTRTAYFENNVYTNTVSPR